MYTLTIRYFTKKEETTEHSTFTEAVQKANKASKDGDFRSAKISNNGQVLWENYA
jgi:hypothetical protein